MKNLIIAVIGLIVLLVLVLFIHRWIKKRKEDKLKEGGINLGAQTGLGEGDDAKIINNLKKGDLLNQKAIVDNTPVQEIGEAIYNAKGVFKDDNDAVYSAIGRIKTKAALSYVSNYFKMAYKITLIGYLQQFLNTEELGKVNEIISKLK